MTKPTISSVFISMETMVDEIPPTTDDRTAPTPRAGWDLSAERWIALFASIARGEVAALHDLYDHAAHRLYGLALWRTGSPEDAADVVQEVFVKVAEQGRRLERVRNPRSWLLTVTHRLAVDLTRRRKVRQSEVLDEHPYLEADSSDAGRSVDARRASAHLARLPGRQRDAIYLRHFADCTFAEIARIVGVPTFTAASRYRLGLQRLRRLMEQEQ